MDVMYLNWEKTAGLFYDAYKNKISWIFTDKHSMIDSFIVSGEKIIDCVTGHIMIDQDQRHIKLTRRDDDSGYFMWSDRPDNYTIKHLADLQVYT